MKRTISALLIVVMALAAVPATAADKETTKAPAETNAKPIATAIQKADLTRPTAKSLAAQKVPTSLPRSGSNRIRKQGGGGKTGMIIGLVTTVVGLGATVYMVKEMNKENDNQ